MVIRSPNSHQGAKKQLVKALHGTLYPAEDPEPGEEEEVDKIVCKHRPGILRLCMRRQPQIHSTSKKRWDDFVAKVQFYGVLKKAMKPPMTLDRVEFSIALFKALPTLFPSPAAPPKKLGHASEALIHVLQPTEDPTVYLQKRSLSSPILLVDDSNCLVAIGTTPITTFAKQDLHEGLLYLMAYYYTIHLTYPKCVATILSVIQTEILKDTIHDRDATASYKKAMAEWKAFIGE
ncbi:uncharacterized protein LOC117550355 [Gymnodraco acuticeps]|uniref:Uncharacterized protein LOC117550355 n=1 Tax=Gymnodraco acuticeps TaxID=8218 RepID=A0A6P8VRK7_GYMAC|nr:uncharacterized protein LOC117550355 [Gymnodraco acuticeps]